MRASIVFYSLLCGAFAVFVIGCAGGSDAGPQTVPVSGTVYLNGEPLADAEVRFINEGFASFGQTGPDGRYELVQGAVPGQNVVTVSKIEGGAGMELNPDEGMDAAQLEAMRMGMEGDPGSANVTVDLPRQLVPPEFSDPDKSKLTYAVPESGTTSADLRLSGP